MEKRCLGDVHYNKDEMVHLKSFQTTYGGLCQQDARTRFAYLVVGKDEAFKLVGSLKDDKTVVDALKGEYSSYLSKAIDKEIALVKKTPLLFDDDYFIDNKKLVNLFSVPARNSSCKVMFLKGMKYGAASKNIDESKEVSNEKRNISYLKKSFRECKELLKQERREAKQTGTIYRPYALISVPYVYNVRYDENKVKSYECIKYDNEVSVSLMPKVKVEYGVFFDGTNNNMYNIDFYQDYKRFMSDKSKYVYDHAKQYVEDVNNDLYSKDATKDDVDPINYIATHPNPEKDPKVMRNLRSAIINSGIRYFEPSSNVPNVYGNDKASKDTEKVFDFLIEIRKTKINKNTQEYRREKMVRGHKHKNVTGKPEEIKEFLMEEILPTNDPISSFVNGYTNIKRMYDVYQGLDSKSREKVAHKENLENRFKVYGSGSGTKDPFDRKRLDKDDIPGLALGLSTSGVVAHVVYACEKIVDEFRKHHITYVDELVFDIFGFSRGATEARHFACSIMNNYNRLDDDEYLPYALYTDIENKTIFDSFYDGTDNAYTKIFYNLYEHKYHFNPLRTDVYGVHHDGDLLFSEEDRKKYSPTHQKLIHTNPRYIKDNKEEPINIRSVSFRHINIGDTVTHHGVFQSDDSKELNLAFDENKLGSLYHIMAMDEYRFNFDAHSIFTYSENSAIELLNENDKKNEDGHFKEFIVPGAHADVGGGYKESGPNELIRLPFCTEKDIKQWNKKFGWVGEKNKEPKKVDDITKITDGGFYYVENRLRGALTPLAPLAVYNMINPPKDYYMYRQGLSWEYELVTLRLMQNEAIGKAKKEHNRVPMDLFKFTQDGNIMAWRDTDISDDKKNILDRTYEALSNRSKLSVDEHKELRQHFVHHSSKPFRFSTIKDWIANQPSWQPEEIIFGKRVVYDTAGTELKKWANSWFKS